MKARLLMIYKYGLSPFFHALNGPGQGCRFQPSCSEYAVLAWHEHGAMRGGWMACQRVLRCHPFSRGGFDPVPAKAFVRPSEGHIEHGDVDDQESLSG